MLFPEKLRINGRLQYACLHRPWNPRDYFPAATSTPGILPAAADRLGDLASTRQQYLLAEPRFGWEQNRIGASWPPIKLSPGEWLLAYHRKQEKGNLGYTQSFMIIRETEHGWPVITNRCSRRLMYAAQPWELDGKFATPCLFTCAGQRVGHDLLMTYGAADTKAGAVRVNFDELVRYIRQFDAQGDFQRDSSGTISTFSSSVPRRTPSDTGLPTHDSLSSR